MSTSIKNPIRLIAVFVLAAFLVQDIGWAIPGGISPIVASGTPFISTPSGQISINSLIANPSQLDLPLDAVTLKEVHVGTSGKLIIHIQDAHTNLSGQENLAKTLDHLLTKYDLKTVLVEGSARDASLDQIRKLAPLEEWKIIARRFLYEGIISGEEYLNLTTEYPMKILGIEYRDLYDQAVRFYAKLVDRRKDILDYLRRSKISIERLKTRFYPKELKDYETKKGGGNTDSNTTDFKTGFSDLLQLADKAGYPLTDLPNVSKLKALLEEEKSIDFARANAEQEKLLALFTSQGHQKEVQEFLETSKRVKFSQASQYLLIKKLLTDDAALNSMSELKAYRDYLSKFLDLKLDDLLSELDLLEDKIYEKLLTTEDAHKVRSIDRFLDLLSNAYQIQMSSRDFQMFTLNEKDFPTESWLAFLNQKLAELSLFENMLPYEPLLENARKDFGRFYQIVRQRDEAFVENTHRIMSQQQAKAAVLIAGGYHTAHLTELWRTEGTSYIVLTPVVTDTTDHERYEKLLLRNFREQEKKLVINQHRNTFQTQNPTTTRILGGLRILDAISGSRLAYLPEEVRHFVEMRDPNLLGAIHQAAEMSIANPENIRTGTRGEDQPDSEEDTQTSGARLAFADIEKLKPGELAVSGLGLNGFITGPASVAKTINDKLNSLTTPDQISFNYTQGEIQVLFTRRKTGPHVVWSFQEADLSKVRELFDLLALEELKSKEISVSGAGLNGFILNLKVAVQTINDKLNSLTTPNQVSFNYQQGDIQVLFSRRRSGPHNVWSFQEADLSKVQKLFGLLALEELKSEELSVSGSGLNGFILNSKVAAQTINDKLDNLTTPNQISFNYQQGDAQVLFSRRRSGKHIVWSFPEADLSKVREIFGLGKPIVIEELKPGELAVSGSGLSGFIINTVPAAKTINDKLNSLSTPGQTSFNYTQGDAQVLFTRRKSGSSTIWSFQEADLPKVQQLFGLTLEKLKPEELAVSDSGLKGFIINPELAATMIKDKLNSLTTPDQMSINYTQGGIQVLFSRRRYGPRPIWSFQKADLSKVQELFGLKKSVATEELKPGELAVSFGGLKGNIIDPRFAAKTINDKLNSLTTPDQISFNYSQGEDQVLFTRRKAGPHIVWSFQKADLSKVQEFFSLEKLVVLEELKPGDLAVTDPGLRGVIINSAVAAKIINDKLNSLTTQDQTSFNFQQGNIQVLFIRRKIGRSNTVWSFSASDLSKVSQLFSLELSMGQEDDSHLEDLGISDAIALLGDDPLRFYQWVKIYHPELSPEELDKVAKASINGLSGHIEDTEDLSLAYTQTLDNPVLINPVTSTSSHSVMIKGTAPKDTNFIQVVGAYTRKIRVKPDGSFEASLPLPKTGEVNNFTLYAINPQEETRSQVITFEVTQTSSKEDIQDSFLKLLSLKEEVLESVKNNPGRYEFLLKSVELALLGRFTYSEEEGFEYLNQKIKDETSRAQKSILKAVLEEFRTISSMEYSLKEGHRLYFFQKYTIYKVKEAQEGGKKGLLIANEQGMGKTLTALIALNGASSTVLAPNSVVSTWAEQEEEFLKEPRLEVIRGPYSERFKDLEGKDSVITNIEFARGMTQEKKEALSRPKGILVVDEADVLASQKSQQAQGIREIDAGFKLLLSATPFKKVSQIRQLFGFLYPEDERFKSPKAFLKAFPENDQQAMNILFLLFLNSSIRIRKKDVFKTYDRNVPLKDQSDRLPEKTEMPSSEGQFYLVKEQIDSIQELFTDYQTWCQKHKGHESTEDQSFYRYSEGFFSKREALRQIMNDPAYIGKSDIESPKHLKMDELIAKEMKLNPKEKVLIFARYKAEVDEYLKRYAKYNPRAYYGDLKQNSEGYKVDEEGGVLYYQVDNYGNYILDKGRPVQVDKSLGKPIQALDYERILFQNDPDSQIMIATYDTGAVGVTFTAADAVIFDDLAPTYRDAYQAEDRAHRIDNKRKKYEVRYYTLQALYPEEALASLDPKVRREFFDIGTYDQIHFQNLQRQKRIFHRILDGVGSEDELRDQSARFMKDRMPFMFEQGAAGQESEDASEGASENKEEAGARLAAQIIEPLKSGELAASGPKLKGIFSHPAAAAKTITESLNGFNSQDQVSIWYGKGAVKTNFIKRKVGNMTTWSFQETDIAKIATLFELNIVEGIEELKPGELAVSLSGLKGLISNPGAAARIINNGLDDTNSQDQVSIWYGKGDLRTRFIKRQVGNGKTSWSFQEADLAKIVTLFQLNSSEKGIEKLKTGEVAVSRHGLEEFISNSKVSARIIDNGLDSINSQDQTSIWYGKGSMRTQFIKRKVGGGKTIWSFQEADIAKVATLFELNILEGIDGLRPGELAVSFSGLKGLVSNPSAAARIINNDLDNINPQDQTSISYGKGDIRTQFIKRKVGGGQTIWSFQEADIAKVMTLFKLGSSEGVEKLKPGELVISEPALKGLILKPASAAKAINEKLDALNTNNEVIVRYGKGDAEILFTKRKSWVHTVWSFPSSDLKKLIALFSLELLSDQNDDFYLEDLGLSDAIALLGDDSLRFVQWLKIYHPELSPEEIDRVAKASLKGLFGGHDDIEDPHLNFKETLGQPIVINPPTTTNSHSITVKGTASKGATFIQVRGAYTRKIRVKPDGSFEGILPLPKTGEANSFTLYTIDPQNEIKSPTIVFEVEQTSAKEDVEESFLRLLAMKEEVLQSVKKDPGRYEFLLKSVELALLGRFTYDEKDGFNYLQQKIKQEKSKTQRTILEVIHKEFKDIASQAWPLKKGHRLYFFQKYTIYKTRKAQKDGKTGLLIANEQGMGKTLTTLVALNSQPATVLAPNSVVTTWAEQEEEFLPEPKFNVLRGSYTDRMSELEMDPGSFITNIEFARGMNPQKKEALSRPSGMLVVDEADVLGSETSQQAKGIREIDAAFKLLLSATPFKRISQIRQIFAFIYPNDERFKSGKAFARAFPPDDPQAMNALFILFLNHSIRIRKKDVFKTYDRNVSLDKQSDRLPEKVEKEIAEGQFDLTKVQVDSILELFTNYQTWCEKHKGHESVEDASFYRYSEGFFSKREALRQIMNDPAYIGRPDVESPKHLKMDQIVKKEMGLNPQGKLLIFVRYKAEVEEYLKRYARYSPRAYYGDLKQNSEGYKTDSDGKVLYYQVDEYGNYKLDRGKFIPADKATGKPIQALDFERILFQNDPESQIMIATYDTGAVGVTFTAADAVIFDDLPPTYRDFYQAQDRAHRIDNNRKKYEVRYYTLQALYPEKALKGIGAKYRHEYFDVGTYDQIHYDNLQRQKKTFHRILDGVGSEAELTEQNIGFMRNHMPFLFKKGEADQEQQSKEGARLAGNRPELNLHALITGQPLPMTRTEETQLAGQDKEFWLKAVTGAHSMRIIGKLPVGLPDGARFAVATIQADRLAEQNRISSVLGNMAQNMESNVQDFVEAVKAFAGDQALKVLVVADAEDEIGQNQGSKKASLTSLNEMLFAQLSENQATDNRIKTVVAGRNGSSWTDAIQAVKEAIAEDRYLVLAMSADRMKLFHSKMLESGIDRDTLEKYIVNASVEPVIPSLQTAAQPSQAVDYAGAIGWGMYLAGLKQGAKNSNQEVVIQIPGVMRPMLGQIKAVSQAKLKRTISLPKSTEDEKPFYDDLSSLELHVRTLTQLFNSMARWVHTIAISA